jgi:HK97 gp10 family phage protein
MNVFDEIRETLARDLEQHLDTVTGGMAQGMRDKLTEGDHIDTGQLIGSIHNDTARSDDGGTISSTISIDATNPQNGAWYAEFLEYGTGIYNETGDGRKTPWRYQDRNGEWHTTRGMQPDPFIRPSVAEHLGELEQGVEHIMGNLKRYRG